MRWRGLLAMAVLAAAAPAHAAEDVFTPLTAVPFNPSTTPIQGTDGRWHFVYELQLANTRSAPATLQTVQVLPAAGAPPLAEFTAADPARRLRRLDSRPAEGAIEPDAARLFLVDFALAEAEIPAALQHRLQLTAPEPAGIEPVEQRYSAATVEVSRHLPTLRPPLAGKGWVAFNGCCGTGVHRATALPVNGRLHYAQRFAIDWMQLDAQGRLRNGPVDDVRSYTSYGAELLAVADGTVVSAADDLPDQTPPHLPDPATITLANVDGNHVVLDIGDGLFAFYAHMQPGSVRVREGQTVRAGEVLGLLGNSGNSSAPHLHFHLMDGASVLGSEGLPYVIDGFALAGNIPATAVPDDLAGDFRRFLAVPQPRREQFPLDMDVIDFTPATPP